MRTLCRWLEVAVEKGHLARSGLGHCRDPFRYYLPERKSKIKPDAGVFHDPVMEMLEEERRRECSAGDSKEADS
jgi:hypothetical protein